MKVIGNFTQPEKPVSAIFPPVFPPLAAARRKRNAVLFCRVPREKREEPIGAALTEIILPFQNSAATLGRIQSICGERGVSCVELAELDG